MEIPFKVADMIWITMLVYLRVKEKFSALVVNIEGDK